MKTKGSNKRRTPHCTCDICGLNVLKSYTGNLFGHTLCIACIKRYCPWEEVLNEVKEKYGKRTNSTTRK